MERKVHLPLHFFPVIPDFVCPGHPGLVPVIPDLFRDLAFSFEKCGKEASPGNKSGGDTRKREIG